MQQFPLMTCESYATMVADSSVKVSTLHFRLLQRLSRCDRTDCVVESRLFSSWRRSFPHDGRSPGSMPRGRRGNGGRLRGLRRHEGAGFLEAIQERFEKLVHGRQGIVIKQRSHPLPQQALAAPLGPHRLKQGATQLLGLIHQERQHHHHGKDHREMLLAMPVVVLKIIALVFQRIQGLVFDLPPGTSPLHEPLHVALAHAYVCHPTEVLDLGLASLPVLDEMDLHVRIRLIERHVIDKAKAMDNPGGAVMSFIIGDAPSLLRCLHLLDQKGMVAFFDTQNVVKIVVVQDLNMRSIGTQAVFGDDELEVGVILTQFGNEPFGGSALTIIFVRRKAKKLERAYSPDVTIPPSSRLWHVCYPRGPCDHVYQPWEPGDSRRWM
jgi:hypothetical protein